MQHFFVLMKKSVIFMRTICYSISIFLISNRNNVKYYYPRTNESNLRNNPLLESWMATL
jgi:hypothetical protein